MVLQKALGAATEVAPNEKLMPAPSFPKLMPGNLMPGRVPGDLLA